MHGKYEIENQLFYHITPLFQGSFEIGDMTNIVVSN